MSQILISGEAELEATMIIFHVNNQPTLGGETRDLSETYINNLFEHGM